jgi:hypothetical protein
MEKGDLIMRGETVESQKERVLARLHAAGAEGLTKSQLGGKRAKGAAVQALRELLSERRVANLGSPTRTCFVSIQHFNPLERACAQVEKNALSGKSAPDHAIELLTRKELEKGCTGEVRKKIAEALDWLVKEKRLVKLRRRRSVYFLSAEKLGRMAALTTLEPGEAIEPSSPPSRDASTGSIDRRLVLAAYQRLRSGLGYSNVEISQLQRELKIPMDALKRFLLEESTRGHAVLSLGDWSVSSDEIRSGAIELFGKPHLLVRFDAE